MEFVWTLASPRLTDLRVMSFGGWYAHVSAATNKKFSWGQMPLSFLEN